MADLHLAEREYLGGRKLAEMGLRAWRTAWPSRMMRCAAQLSICDNPSFGNRGEESFRRWCESMQIGKSTAYKLLQVSNLFERSTPREQKVLEELSPVLLLRRRPSIRRARGRCSAQKAAISPHTSSTGNWRPS